MKLSLIARSLFVTTLVASGLSTCHAHFIWLYPVKSDNGSTSVQVYFGEEAAPDSPELLSRLKGMKLVRIRGKEAAVPVTLKHGEDSLFAAVPDFQNRSVFAAKHDLGVMSRGDSTFRLKYYAKSGPAITSSTWQGTETADDLRLDVIPSFDEGKIELKVMFDGKPVSGAEVKAAASGLDDFSGTTDEDGRVAFDMADAGIYSIRARHVEQADGELDGKPYKETRHYSTLAVMVPPLPPMISSRVLAEVPQDITSFGAAICDGHLYTYGGHTGDAHSYSKGEQGKTLMCWNLKGGEWKKLAEGPNLQGLALVTHGKKLYRVGGFSAKNAEGEEQNLWSQSSAAMYDPASPGWQELPPLPEPRSSHDAAVVGDSIYVVGGWAMAGKGETEWHKTAWELDLKASKPEWKPMPTPPFQRRAIALAAHDGKLFVVGGMQQRGGPTRRVDVFDPKTNKWSVGPELPGEGGMTGFGVSAFATGGSLYATTVNGRLQRLKKDGSAWEVIARTPTGRFFHRLLPLNKNELLVVGGANMDIGKFSEIEVLTLSR